MKGLARELKDLVAVMENQESRMYSASILMVYEGDGAALELALEQEKARRAESSARAAGSAFEKGDAEDSSDEDEKRLRSYDMRLIDFAHASWTPGQGPDENALQGLCSVLKILDQISSSVQG